MITAAVSRMFLATNRKTLRRFHVDSPLTEEAREVICRLSNLRELSVVIERGTSLSSVVLPNLTDLTIQYDHDCDWLQGLRGATFEKLASVTIRSSSESVGNFLEVFASVTFKTSVPATLSMFYTSRRLRPNYRSLLLFSQLKELVISFSWEDSFPSGIDDDAIADIALAMPGLEILQLG